MKFTRVVLRSSPLSCHSLLASPIAYPAEQHRGFIIISFARRQQEASDSLGVPVHVAELCAESFQSQRSISTAVTVGRSQPVSAIRPSCSCSHAEAGVRIVSILHKKWYLDNIRVDQPVVQIFRRQERHSNLPTIKSSNSKSQTSIFDLGIRHAVLNQERFSTTTSPAPWQLICITLICTPLQ